MQLYKLTDDIKVLCVPATSFPGGIKAAFNRLHQLVPDARNRPVFGVSKPRDGIIRYSAAVKEKAAGEGEKLGCPTFTMEKGNYLGETLMDWQQNEMLIMSIFNRLVADKRLAGDAHCIEWYKNETELLCLVRLKENISQDNTLALII